jgi:dipeptidyl aminopeptidase/acylaminoacyl peptidase
MQLTRSARIGLACVTLFTSSLASAQQKTITPEVVVSLKTVSNVVIDPTGRNVAYILNTPRIADEDAGAAYRELFIVPAAGGSPKQYTFKPNYVSSAQWSADGRWLYFISNRKAINEHDQVYRLSVDGGEAALLTKAHSGVHQYRVSPDGKSIAYTVTDEQTEAEKTEAKRGSDVRTVDKNLKHVRLYVQPLDGGDSRKLTGDSTVWDFEWSPDSKQLVYQSSPTPKTDDSYMFKKIYITAVEPFAPKVLTETKGKLGNMAWSPNGRQIAFTAGIDQSDPTNGSIFVASSAGGAARNLSERFEGTVTYVGWLNNDTLQFAAIERSHTTLNTISATGSGLQRIIDKDLTFTAVSTSANGQVFAAAANSDLHPAEVFAGNFQSRSAARLTTSNPQLQGITLSGSREIAWKSRDGLEITGMLMLPVDYQAGRRYPSIVQIHGGPESAYLDGWLTNYVAWGELLAAKGFVVFSPNYRGSVGRGVAYAKADHKDLGGKEFEDVLDGLDYLAREGYIDRARVGIGGFSYGGYFSGLAATRYSEHFRAAAMGAGISNWLSFTGTSDIPYENSMVHWNLDVYKNMPLVWDRSPLAHVEKSKTALLISHGDKDERVPLGQAWELYTALKLLGKTVELDIYPREPHGFQERNHQIHSINRTLEWFERYVKDQ